MESTGATSEQLEGACMRAMVLPNPKTMLQLQQVPVPQPGPCQVRVKVTVCGVCRTDLHLVDGELPEPKLPIIPGHEIVGRIDVIGPGVTNFSIGERVGVPWLGWTCGVCEYCRAGKENLCDNAKFTGYQIDGGYAEYTVADARYCFSIPKEYSDLAAAPLMCPGLIGYRCLRKAGLVGGDQGAKRVGIYGFGAAGHIVAQVLRKDGHVVYAFTRPGHPSTALDLGAHWAGSSLSTPPEKLDAVLIFAPVGSLIPATLRAVKKGGIVIAGGIHMSDIPSFPYEILWGERTVTSVANLTREDGREFLDLAPKVPVHTRTRVFPLEQANEALAAMREGHLGGATAVLVP